MIRSPEKADRASMICAFAALDGHADVTVATRPIPVHEIREGRPGRWHDHVPHIGWLFPSTVGAVETAFAQVWSASRRPPHAFDSPDMAAALEMALSSANGSSDECELRLVMTPEGEGVFWIDGACETFVDVAHARIMSGPEFASEFLPKRALSVPACVKAEEVV